MTLDSEKIRGTLRLWVAGVTVVTSVDENDIACGMTVSSFTSVSLDPPQMLICLQKQTTTAQAINHSKKFAVSLLQEGQEEISNLFAGMVELAEGESRFDRVDTHTAVTGSPILKQAIGWLDCRVRDVYDGSTHDIFIGEVVDGSGYNDRAVPLVYFDRQYRKLKLESREK